MTKTTRMYSLANGRPKWLLVSTLKDALQEDARKECLDEWEHIGTTRDLCLTGEQDHNLQAVDMKSPSVTGCVTLLAGAR